MRVRFPVLIVAGIVGCGFSWAVAQHSLLGGRWGFILLIAGWTPLSLVAAWAATGVPVRSSLTAVLILAVALRLAAASGTTPSVSNDLYRYSWDAHVQLAGIDPYRYVPDAPQVAFLRQHSGLWPSPAACRHARQPAGCTHLNRPHVPTIYPPVAEAWFVVVHLLTPGANGSRPWQVAGGLVDDITVVLIALGLRGQRRDPRQVAWYALSPLPVIEFAGNGHVDGLALLLLVAAALALRRERAGWAGLLVGLATMVKLYPALALAAWWRHGRWRLFLSAVAVIGVVEAPHVWTVGWRVLGYVPGYIKEEHYASGGRFLLLGLVGFSGPLATALAVTFFVGLTVLVARSRYEPAAALAAVLAGLILIATPVQPWYAATAAGIGALAGAPWLLVLGLAAEPYYAAVILADPHQVAAGRIGYSVALATIVCFTALKGRSSFPSRPLTLARSRTLPAMRPPRPTLQAALVAVTLAAAAVLAVGAGVLAGGVKAEGGSLRPVPALPRLGPTQTVDQNDVGDPFVLSIPPGIRTPSGVPYQVSGPDGYQSAPWTSATAARAATNGWYVLFGTTDWQENVPTAISVDLTHWTQAPDALPVLPSWAVPSVSMTWAPVAQRTAAGWVLYFSTQDASSRVECIGEATSPTPAGPYTSRAHRPMLCQPSLGGSIDPAIVRSADGLRFLLWKNDGNAVHQPDAIWSRQLSGDGLRLVGAPHKLLTADEPWQQGIVEAPAMLPATPGGYWLFYAGGSWDSNRYYTGIAYCSRVTGPCADASRRPFLSTRSSMISPAGLDTFSDLQGRRWAAFTALVLVPSTWHPGEYYYNRVLDISPVLSR